MPHPTRWTGINMSESTLALDWSQIKEPAIFEIKCKRTRRRYIGSSARPDLRRAVYFHHLNNPRHYSTSNIFFGIRQLELDLQRWGVSGFVFNILERMPGASERELSARRQEIIDGIPRKELYNRKVDNCGFFPSIFSQLDEGVAAMEQERREIRAELDKSEAAYARIRNLVASERNRLTELRNQQKITSNYLRTTLRSLSERRLEQMQERNALAFKLDELTYALRQRNRELIAEYSQEKYKGL